MPDLTNPTSASRPRLFINGQAEESLADSLLELVVDDSIEGRARCRARFLNWGASRDRDGFLYFDADTLAFGNEIAVDAGSSDQSRRIFRGRISAVEGLYPADGPPQIQVYAEDALEALRRTRRTRSFQGKTDAELIQEIAAEHGLQTDIALTGDGGSHDLVAQVDQSDLAFLRQRARRLGATLWLEDNTLMVRPPGDGDTELTKTLHVDLKSFRVRADLAAQVTELGMAGWDSDSKSSIDERTRGEFADTAPFGEFTGAAVQEMAFGPRVDFVSRELALSHDEARAMVQSRYLETAEGFVLGEGLCAGDARLRAGGAISLAGLGTWFDGRYHVNSVSHHYDAESGYRTAFRAGRPALDDARVSSRGRPKRKGRQTPPGKEKPNKKSKRRSDPCP